MASVNRVTLVGNLGQDPETRTFPSGDQVCNVSLATTDKWKDKESGEQREATEWHRLQFNGRLAEIAAQYLRKGSQVYVEGSIRTRKYTDKDGVERYAVDIRVDQMQMLGGPRDDDGGGRGQGGGGRGQGGYDNGGGQQRNQGSGGGQRSQGGYERPAAGAGRAPQGGGGYGQSTTGGGRTPAPAPAQRNSTGAAPAGRGSSGFDDMDDDIPF